MIDPGTTANIVGTFPTVSAKNASGGGATDGTPLTAQWLSDIWGVFQSLLAEVGMTPSGVAEAFVGDTGVLPLGTSATQIKTALRLAYGGPGDFVLWGRNQDPTTVGAKVLILVGQTVAISSYKDLVAATYCGDTLNPTAGAFYKTSDSGGSTRSTSGAYFHLPDARGVTIRGVDTGNTRDPYGNTRGGGYPVGSFQNFALQGHEHGSTYPATAGSSSGYILATNGSGTISYPTITQDATHGVVQVDSETRMANIAVYIGIRY